MASLECQFTTYYVGMLPQLQYDSEVPNAVDPIGAMQGLTKMT